MRLHVLTKPVRVEIPGLSEKRRRRTLDPLTELIWCAGPAIPSMGMWVFSINLAGVWIDVAASEKPEIEAA